MCSTEEAVGKTVAIITNLQFEPMKESFRTWGVEGENFFYSVWMLTLLSSS